LAYRNHMPPPLGGTAEQYRIHQVLPDGEFVDLGP
jgi:hypothetical protein